VPVISPAFSPAFANTAQPFTLSGADSNTPPNIPDRRPDNGLMDDTKDRFLTLLVTQLRNQDPLNPMENAEVTSQIAQLSTVNGIEQLNKTLVAMSGQMDFSQAMQAASLIGKGVLVPGEKIRLGHEGEGADAVPVATPFGFELYAASSETTVEILDESGQVVRKMQLGDQDAGVHDLQWDGLDDEGRAMPAGAYRVRVNALDGEGKKLTVETLSYGKVGSVAYAAGGLQLDLGLAGACTLYDIRQVM